MVLSFTEPDWSLSSSQDQPVVVEQLVLLENDDNLRLVDFASSSSLLLKFLKCIYLAEKVWIG